MLSEMFNRALSTTKRAVELTIWLPDDSPAANVWIVDQPVEPPVTASMLAVIPPVAELLTTAATRVTGVPKWATPPIPVLAPPSPDTPVDVAPFHTWLATGRDKAMCHPAFPLGDSTYASPGG